jgi:glyoxylase-like metal-dependent hydrolase (beta-lactamase superfamily II)/ferredoxin
MASEAKRLRRNVTGDVYVDSTCIDCGACCWIAPKTFVGIGNASVVRRQPKGPEEIFRAELALVACPVGAIGTETRHDLKAARAGFPEPVADEVHYCGYHAAASFGASSYLIVRRQGNILVDSPRFARALVERIEALGGVKLMFLTHRDDVADHRKFRAHFGCERMIHARDVTRATQDVEIKLEGDAPIAHDADVLILPTPGHTAGSTSLLYRERFLFSGDHLWWDRDLAAIDAEEAVCWYDWDAQRRSIERLAAYRFEWLLPGHGERCHFPAAEMKAELARTLKRLGRVEA